MEPRKSAATQAWEDELLHPRREKHGRIPMAAGQKQEKTVDRGEPSHGMTDRGKSSEHARVHPGKPYPEGAKVGVKKANGSVIGKDTHPECYE